MRKEQNNTGYLTTRYKGIYRIKVPYDKTTNQFPHKLDGTFEDIDCYIDCQHGNKIFHFGRSILQAYIPSLQRGRNIIKYINETFGEDIIFNIEETDSEVLFRFNVKDDDKIIPLLKPKTSGADISPFSTRNLPRNKDYKIPDEDSLRYKDISSKIPKERILELTHITNSYLKSLVNKKNTWEDIKADMALRGLKAKEYIHSIGKWDEYIVYLSERIEINGLQ